MIAKSKLKKVHLWFPNIFEFKGGIQVYSAFLLQALQNLYPQSQHDVFLMHDTRVTSDVPYQPDTRFHFAGDWAPIVRAPMFAVQMIAQGLWQRPELIIATHLNFTIAAHWLKRLTGIPYWAVAHGIEAWNIERPALQAALQNADRILCVSSYTRDRLLKEQNLDPNRLSLLPNTFDDSRFQWAPKPAYLLEQHKLEADQPVILTVSRLSASEQYKGYDRILRALPQIRQAIPDAHYVIVGKGDDRPRIEKLIQQLELQNCVTLAGFVPDEQICDYYNLCDVFAMPSQGEGFGIVYLEALACGKPTLGGNQDGAIDALCHGTLGSLVAPENVEEIAQAIIQILQGSYPNPLIYQPQALRQKVLEVYGFKQFQQTLSEHLETFLF
jgi:glycosyltransferase involved in cell wall biosynthesis